LHWSLPENKMKIKAAYLKSNSADSMALTKDPSSIELSPAWLICEPLHYVGESFSKSCMSNPLDFASTISNQQDWEHSNSIKFYYFASSFNIRTVFFLSVGLEKKSGAHTC